MKGTAKLPRRWMGAIRPLMRARTARAACLLGAMLCGTAPARAQRAPVLPAITLPHPYYFRELYLPQLTTGPSAVTWSPKGDAVIYSMRGSLWRQALTSDTAVQLTDGPGAVYDYQPDWSPDGRYVVFVRRTTEGMQLVSLDLQAGREFIIAASGVNVEPRISPQGDRLAWVVMGDRAHVHVAPFDGHALGTAVRVTEERNSTLPRYYYSPWDHYLSPTWSPRGDELIVVSNRGKVWGTGGLWRLELGTGTMRSVRDEETNWKARPDWAPAGGRVVWSSYAGRQWHQLWLTTADGGEPLQLTYGEFDLTGARWSRDGQRMACISNERGTTSLWIISAVGGARREVVARHRVYRAPQGTLRLVVTDAATGRAIPARLSVTHADGRAYGPDSAWLQADDSFDRKTRPLEFTYFHSQGPAIVSLPAGRATVEVMHGVEYQPVARTVRVVAGQEISVRVALVRLDDPAARGWISGDLHVHMNYGGTYRNTPERLVRQARAEGLRVVENLIVNKEGRIPDIGYFSANPDPASTADVMLKHDQEFHTSFWGHTGLLGLSEHLVQPMYAGYANTAAAALAPLNTDVMRAARAQGGIAGYVHPDGYPNVADTTRRLTYAFPIDLALGTVDYFEALGFSDDFLDSQKLWFAALNCGFRVAAGAGTDAMANYTSLRGPVGMNRVYAQVRGPMTHRAFLDAIKAGRTFATNAPLLDLSVNGTGIGGEVRPSASSTPLLVRVHLRSMVPIDHLEIIQNGVVVATVPTPGDHTRADTTVRIARARSGWLVLRAWSNDAVHPVLDLRPMGVTSPVYLQVAGDTLRAPVERRDFVAWIDRLRVAAERSTAWNSDAERSAALGTIAESRARMEQSCGGA